jgi:hypothetical protein
MLISFVWFADPSPIFYRASIRTFPAISPGEEAVTTISPGLPAERTGIETGQSM